MSNILISTLLLYKNDVSRRFLESLIPYLHAHCQKTDDHITLVVTNNAPDNNISDVVEATSDLLSSLSNQVVVKFVSNDCNLGFGEGHNQAFKLYQSDYFLIINNDLFISEPDWLTKMIDELGDEKTAMVGASNSPTILRNDATGWYGKKNDIQDYAEGSLLLCRSSLIQKFGLFAPDIYKVYYEDSDLCLRYRQLGCNISTIPIAHRHLRGSSAKKVYANCLHAIQHRNQARFIARWKNYLANRQLHNKILLNLFSAGWGDVWNAIPAISSLLKTHPTAIIEVEVKQDFLIPYLQINERVVVKIVKKTLSDQSIKKLSKQYDRVFSFSQINYADLSYLASNISASIGTDSDYAGSLNHIKNVVTGLKPVTDSVKKPDILPPEKYAVIHCDYQRSEWEGRGVCPSKFLSLQKYLKQIGYQTVLIGSRNDDPQYRLLASEVDLDLSGAQTFDELAKTIAGAHLFLGLDSGPLHLAQTFDIPTFIIFGATNPFSRLRNWHNSAGIFHPELDCIGCYHAITELGFNYCIRRDQACVKQIDEKYILQQFQNFINNDFKLPPDGRMLKQIDIWIARQIELNNRIKYLSTAPVSQLEDISYLDQNVKASTMIVSLLYKIPRKIIQTYTRVINYIYRKTKKEK